MVLFAVENKISDVSCLVKKTAYNTKIREFKTKRTDDNHDKYITTPNFNKITAEKFTATLEQANLVTKRDFDDEPSSFNEKINWNKRKHLLVKNEFKKLPTFDSSYFIGKKHFEEDGTQNQLVFQPMYRYFKRVSGVASGSYIKGLSVENITTPTKSNFKLNPQLSYFGT